MYLQKTKFYAFNYYHRSTPLVPSRVQNFNYFLFSIGHCQISSSSGKVRSLFSPCFSFLGAASFAKKVQCASRDSNPDYQLSSYLFGAAFCLQKGFRSASRSLAAPEPSPRSEVSKLRYTPAIKKNKKCFIKIAVFQNQRCQNTREHGS